MFSIAKSFLLFLCITGCFWGFLAECPASMEVVAEANSERQEITPPPLWCWLFLAGLSLISALILYYEIPKNRNRGQGPFRFDQ